MTDKTIETLRTIEIDHRGVVAWVGLTRPATHNALDEVMIEDITAAFRTPEQDTAVRVIALAGRGSPFSAGADIESMKRQGSAPLEQNLANARQLAEMFRTIAKTPKPTIARVNGAAIGGGLGL